MFFKLRTLSIAVLLVLPGAFLSAQPAKLDQYNVVWTTQSRNSGESMPCGGGDIGMNVWVENGEIFYYVSRSGSFDENNTLLKTGRVRLRLSPNPFEQGAEFRQELLLKEGVVKITGTKAGLSATVTLWADVFRPVVHTEIKSNKPVSTEAAFESWRYADRSSKGKENNANSWKWAPQGEVKTLKDEIGFRGDAVYFFHRNRENTVFDVTVKQQGMESVKDQLYNPLDKLSFGGKMEGLNMKASGSADGKYMDTDFRSWKLSSRSPARTHEIRLSLYTENAQAQEIWEAGLQKVIRDADKNKSDAAKKSRQWWREYWERTYVFINAADTGRAWQTGRNYQLFRYMLGCNAFGKYPTKFNGGLFTYDPSLTDTLLKYTPDFRNWGGGTHTAQNQRLVYWPMLRSGDSQMMKPQFDFYLRLLKNAELRSKVYWNHEGASFTEQLENFGLPNPAEYNWKRPAAYDKGMEHNAWLEYEWDTVLEFCMMILENERYVGQNIGEYMPLIESSLRFFNEHYQYLAKQRGSKTFDGNGHLVLYPGSGAETYKMAYNSTSTIAALRTVLSRILELPSSYVPDLKREEWKTMLNRLPPLSFREFGGHPTIAPAKLWERINNTESPQLYPVFPWGIYGIGKPGIDTAINTFRYDADVLKFRSHVGWKQDNIFAARLGLTKEAAELNFLKLKDSGRRFPAFWGPGFDWTPDHNWGGSGMIGLQEMLMQTDDKKIYLFPAWPKDQDVHFKLHAPYKTTVEAELKNGKIVSLKVIPESRRKDITVMNYGEQ